MCGQYYDRPNTLEMLRFPRKDKNEDALKNSRRHSGHTHGWMDGLVCLCVCVNTLQDGNALRGDSFNFIPKGCLKPVKLVQWVVMADKSDAQQAERMARDMYNAACGECVHTHAPPSSSHLVCVCVCVCVFSTRHGRLGAAQVADQHAAECHAGRPPDPRKGDQRSAVRGYAIVTEMSVCLEQHHTNLQRTQHTTHREREGEDVRLCVCAGISGGGGGALREKRAADFALGFAADLVRAITAADLSKVRA